MPSVSRKSYSRPVPPDAVPAMVTVKRRGRNVQVPGVKFTDTNGKQITAPLTASGDRYRMQTRVYYGRVAGKVVPLTESKAASEIMLGDLRKMAIHRRAGLVSPYEESESLPLAVHLEGFRKELEARDRAPRYIELVLSRLQAIFTACKFHTLRDLDADKVAGWLAEQRKGETSRRPLPDLEEFELEEVAVVLGIKAISVAPLIRRHNLPATGKGKARRFPRTTVQRLLELRAPGISIATLNGHMTHLKVFANWLVRGRKMAANPFLHLTPGNAATDKRHHRRAMTPEELGRVLSAARSSPRSWRGLNGRDRFHLYALALATGFRASGLAAMKPECFDLAGPVPTVILPVKSDKSRRGKRQPLAPDIAELFRQYLKGKTPGKPIWAGTWAEYRTGAAMLRIDLATAGVPYVVQGPDGPLYSDLHSLRHCYCTMLGKAEVGLQIAQTLAGHASPDMTMRYTHQDLGDLARAVGKMPAFLPPHEESNPVPLKATGTDGPGSSPISACSNLAHSPDGERQELRFPEGMTLSNVPGKDSLQPLETVGVDSERGDLMELASRAGDGIRTHDVQLGKLDLSFRKSKSGKQVTSDASSLLAQILPNVPDDLRELLLAWGSLPLFARSAISTIVRSALPSDPR